MSLVSELVRGDVGGEERVNVDMFCICSEHVEAEVTELTEITETDTETSVFPFLFLLNFVGLMKSMIG